MSNRTVASTGRLASREIRDVVQAALIAELMNPSTRLWLASAWVTDAVVIENSGGEFCTFVPEWPERGIRLSEVLAQLAMAGSKVTVVTNSDERNATFSHALRARVGHLSEVEFHTMPELHRKRLVTECVELKGSMNFTHFGLNRNAEDLVMDTSPEGVAGAINDMEEMLASLRAVP